MAQTTRIVEAADVGSHEVVHNMSARVLRPGTNSGAKKSRARAASVRDERLEGGGGGAAEATSGMVRGEVLDRWRRTTAGVRRMLHHKEAGQ